MRKLTTFTLILLLCSLWTAVLNIGMVKAEETIYIRADGSIEGTDKIQRNGNIYTFAGDIIDSIVVEKDDVVIDGAGYILQGEGSGRGINLGKRCNVTIKNMQIREFYIGIYLKESFSNIINGNKISNNEKGVYILWSSDNVLRNNQFQNNSNNISVEHHIGHHLTISELVNDIDESNTVNGKPIYYWINQHDRIVPSDGGYVALINCTGITVQNLHLTNNGPRMLLVSTNNSIITQKQHNRQQLLRLWHLSFGIA
jgi:parallel beta-helix repeat protein